MAIWVIEASEASDVSLFSAMLASVSSEMCVELVITAMFTAYKPTEARARTKNTFMFYFFNSRSILAKQRARVGPILPSGIPSAAAMSAYEGGSAA